MHIGKIWMQELVNLAGHFRKNLDQLFIGQTL
jgi:hypothetical protein